MAEVKGPIAEAETTPAPVNHVKHLSPITDKYASVESRFLAVLIDTALIGFSIVIIFVTPWSNQVPFKVEGYPILLIIVFLFSLVLYHTLLEGLTGVTLGKWLIGTKVVKQDFSNVDIGTAAVRNIVRLVDGVPFLIPYLLGFLIMLRRPNRQRCGDILARTIVINV